MYKDLDEDMNYPLMKSEVTIANMLGCRVKTQKYFGKL